MAMDKAFNISLYTVTIFVIRPLLTSTGDPDSLSSRLSNRHLLQRDLLNIVGNMGVFGVLVRDR